MCCPSRSAWLRRASRADAVCAFSQSRGGRCCSMRRYGLWPDAANTSSQQAEEHTEGGRGGGC